MVDLRKRKAPAESSAPPPKKAASVKGATSKASKPTHTGPAASRPTGPPAVGSTIDLEGFGGDIEDNDGNPTSLKKMVDESKGGVALLTYPKASTPGCTTQVCLARDQYAQLTSSGFSIFGISRDSPKANSTFKARQSLPFALLCDQKGTLISAIGLKKPPSGTTRGVFVVSKEGKVLASEAGGPANTVGVVKRLADEGDASLPKDVGGKAEISAQEEAVVDGGQVSAPQDVLEEDVQQALVAADVADTAKKLDAPPTPAGA